MIEQQLTRTITGVLADPQQYQQPQVPQQLPGISSGSTLVLILCGALVFTTCKKNKAMRWPIFAAIVVGVLVSGSVIGSTVKQTSGTAGTQMEQMVNGFNTGTGTGTGNTSYQTQP